MITVEQITDAELRRLQEIELKAREFIGVYVKSWNLHRDQETRNAINALGKSLEMLPSPPENLLDVRVDSLEVSVRSRNCLAMRGVETLRQLTEYSGSDLLRIRSFGKTCLKEIEKALAAKGLKLALEQSL
jgi:DNA-directed RNA polymerase alpha subunit